MDHQEPYSLVIRCSEKQPCVFACMNQNCQRYAFICSNNNCKCRRQHQNCMLLMTQTLLKTMNQKIIPVKQFEASIEKNIQKLINELSNLRDKLLLETNTKLQQYGLSENNKQFLNLVRSSKPESITGNKIWSAILELKPTQNLLLQLQNQSQKIDHLFNDCAQYIREWTTRILIDINRLKDISEGKKLCNFYHSKIITTLDDQLSIEAFFEDNKIKHAELLLRASQNEFSVDKVHEKCHNIPHTLVVCETEFGKKIGGYTPIPWKYATCATQVSDESGESFIFSLTENDKFTLQNKRYAVYHRNDGAFMHFGNCDFRLIDKANQKRNCSGNINSYYFNKNYQQGNAESWKRFTGNPQNSHNFKAKEYEIWKLQFM